MPTLQIRQLEFLAPVSSRVRQLEQPGRLRKDILRVGRWRVGDDYWNVTPDTLRQLKQNFDSGQANGLDCPVVWNHSEDARDRCGKVLSLDIEGDELFAVFDVSDPANVGQIKESGGVSVQVREPFIDGIGNEYPLMLTHLGIVNHPVVPGQGRFRELSLQKQKETNVMRKYATRKLRLANGKIKSITRCLAEGEEVAPDEVVSDAPPVEEAPAPAEYPVLDEVQYGALSEPVSKLLTAAFGVTLPDGTTGENFIANLLNTISVAEQIVPDVTEETPAEVVDAMPIEDMTPAEVAMALKVTRKRIAKDRELAIKQSEVNYTAKLESLLNAGVVLAKDKAGLMQAGKSSKWSMSILSVFDGRDPQIHTKSKVRNVVKEDGGEPTYSDRRNMGLKLIGRSRKTNS